MASSSSHTDPSLAALSSHPLPGTDDHDDTYRLAPSVPGSERYRKTSLAPSVGGQSFVSDSTEQYFTDANDDAQSAITITRSDTSASFQDADNTFSSSPDLPNHMTRSQSTQRAPSRSPSPPLMSQLASAAGPATAAAAGAANVPVKVVPPTPTLPSGAETSVEPGANPTKEDEYDEKSAGLKTVPSSSQTDETKAGGSTGGEKLGAGGGAGGDDAVDLEDPELSHLTDEQRRIVVEQM